MTTINKSQKTHQCFACFGLIPKGEKHDWRVTHRDFMNGGRAFYHRIHMRCLPEYFHMIANTKAPDRKGIDENICH